MMLESKKLDTDLRMLGLACSPMVWHINFILILKWTIRWTEYFSVTDGIRWEIYKPHEPVPINERG